MGVMETYTMSAGGGWKGKTREWILVKGKTKKTTVEWITTIASILGECSGFQGF